MSGHSGEAGRRSRAGRYALTSIVLLWLACIIGFSSAAVLTEFSIGGQPTDDQRNRAGIYEVLLAVTAVGLPVLGAGVAAATRRIVWAVVLVVAAVALTVPASWVGRIGVHDMRAGRPVEPPQQVHHCVPRSGGRGCPGG